MFEDIGVDRHPHNEYARYFSGVAAKPFHNIVLDGENLMQDREDLKLKAELDEIMKSVDIIMKNVEIVMPAKEEDAQPETQ